MIRDINSVDMNKQIEWRCPDEIIKAVREMDLQVSGRKTTQRRGEMNICPWVSRGTTPTWGDETLKITAISTLCLDDPL